jgi:hypothetical protein
MTVFGAILGSLGVFSLLYALVTLAQFSRKLGAVTKMRPFYRGYYAAAGLVGLALVMRLVRTSVFLASPQSMSPVLEEPLFYFFLYHLPLALGTTLGVALTWHYWSWLLKER